MALALTMRRLALNEKGMAGLRGDEVHILKPGVHSRVKRFFGERDMQIGELAAATGLSRDTLRFYEARGLLTARRRGNGYRDYPPEAVEWLCYLRTAQSL